MTTRTLAELARLCDAELLGDPQRTVAGPAPLRDAGPDEVSFLGHPKYARLLATTRAAAVLVPRAAVDGGSGGAAGGAAAPRRAGLALLVCADPSRAFTRIVEAFAPRPSAPPPGVHASAVVDPTAELGAGCHVGACAVVEAGARIGAGAIVGAGTFVGRGARVGDRTRLHPRVVLYDGVALGADCVVHSGAVLGSDGFGFEPRGGRWEKIPQCGTVEVGDRVEIGANVAIDRARFGATRIGDDCKLDNLVHVAHNVVLERGVLLVAQVGISGSVRVGEGSILAGQVGIAGHVELAPGVRVGAQSGVSNDIAEAGEYWGSPARPAGLGKRYALVGPRVERQAERLRELERRVAELERGGA